MERNSYKYIQMNTSTYLLKACDEVALQIRKKAKFSGEGYPDYIFTEKYSDIKLSPVLIGLNLIYINQLAAVLEGSLRALLCEVMQIDAGRIGELSISRKVEDDYTAICRAYSITAKYRDDVEFKGGWDNLKRQYKEVFGKNIDSVLDKEKSSGLNSIFTLRNVAAHGTSIVTPKEKLEDGGESDYLFKWQRKLQGLSIYIKKEFDLELLDALQHPSLSYHFTELVKEFVKGFRGSSKLPTNSQVLFNNIENYSFGYRNNFESSMVG
ncbi:hypothetical protein [Zobellella iuensis]|uniref:RiboL-PSP-HEPN domain-containing protein n=1 Tax=Zobellella iuensis TaxID=2803811 RepID=A0ABS1QP59_9GAMM|nr:hypothetical protein [Zobellella iuensis]MBL1376647.1 hypothetical protein [Zobellella iuensis]